MSPDRVGGAPVRVHVYDGTLFRYAVAARIAAILRQAQARNDPITVVVSAGRTPTGAYQVLRDYRSTVDFSRVRLVQMDEYAGLSPSHGASLAAYLLREVVKPLGIRRFLTLNDERGRLRRPLSEHEALARSAALVVHGIGRNGHLGFNEPPSGPDEPSRAVLLDPATCVDNGLTDGPVEALTLGTAVLLTAEHTVLLARGTAKATAVAAAVQGPPSPACPASWLQTVPGCSVHLDRDAAAGLRVLPRTA